MMRSDQYHTCLNSIRSLKHDFAQLNVNVDLIHVLLFDKFKLLMNEYTRHFGQEDSKEIDLIFFHKLLEESIEGNRGVIEIQEDLKDDGLFNAYGNYHPLFIYLYIHFELNKAKINKLKVSQIGNPFLPLIVILTSGGNIWKHNGWFYLNNINVELKTTGMGFELPNSSISFFKYLLLNGQNVSRAEDAETLYEEWKRK